MLGHSLVNKKPFRLTGNCPTLSPTDNPRYDPRTYAIYEASFHVHHMPYITTLDTTIQLQLNDTNIACIGAHITPYIGLVTSKVLMGVPLAMMILSGIVTGALKTYQIRRRSTFRYEIDDSLDPADSSMPGVGRCLHYLQFIFLTGCLTLSYPGFFRAVVSELAWSSLIFKNWPVTHQFIYPGVEDGIYSVNATVGLEEMAQYLGSTTTSDLWTNSIVNLAFVVLAVIVTVQIVSVFKWLSQLDAHGLDRSLQRTGWSVARIVLDYFLPPLVSFSLFQMNNARLFPVYHTSMALVAVALLAGLLIITIRHLVKTNKLDVFFHQTCYPGRLGQNWAFYTLSGVPFVRGLAIGGLQTSGLAQIMLLIACEILILSCAFWNWQAGATWRHALLSLARLATTGMSFVFLPEAGVSERRKSIVAYCILSLHATVIIGGFLVDCVYRPVRYALYRMGMLDSVPKSLDRKKVPVFGIQQLSHRSTRRISFAHLPALDPTGYTPPHSRHTSLRHASSEDFGSLDTASFFRPSRPQTASVSSINDATGLPTHALSESGIGCSNIELIRLPPVDSVYETVNTSNDYCRREADEYYAPISHHGTMHSDPAAGESDHPLRFWPWKRPKAKQRGFEVIRPTRPNP
ncbi:hypothetical protein BDW59DRAFT_96657 [Aspergillus cavernicola]|uniref:TRP C-terminal domain-containing protein n=1 Tax=Aspergillus cavernicola TaxID=176166 RepID=A0ABR4I761_9EURO